MAVEMEIQDGSSAPLGTCFIQMVSLVSNKSLSDSPLWRTEGPGFIFHLLTVMGEYLQVLIRQEGSRIDGGDFLKQDLRVVQE